MSQPVDSQQRKTIVLAAMTTSQKQKKKSTGLKQRLIALCSTSWVSTSSMEPDAVTVVQGQPGYLTIHDLGWTGDEARAVRGQFATFADDWDDPAMDIYDEVY